MQHLIKKHVLNGEFDLVRLGPPRIESLREHQITANVVSKPKKSSRSEEILIETLKRRVMELEKENKKLQNQIQKLYGDLYNKE